MRGKLMMKIAKRFDVYLDGIAVVFNVARASGAVVRTVEVIRSEDGVLERACVKGGSASCASAARPVARHVVDDNVRVHP